MIKSLIFIILMIYFTGCTLIPKIETRNILKTDNIQTGISEDEKLVFKGDEWWKVYKDKTLDALIKLILSENSDLKIAQLNMEKSTEAINLVKSQEGFHLDFTGNFKRERITKNGIEPPPLGGKIYNMSSLGLQSSYNMDIFNKFKSLSEEQRYKAEAIKINSKWIELNMAERTTKLYI